MDMDVFNTPAGNLRLIGGRLCLDFCNTVDNHRKAHPKEYLTSYADLIAWSRHSGALEHDTAQQLLREAAGRHAEAAEILQQAIRLRGALYRLFAAIAGGSAPHEADLAMFNRALAAAPQRSRIIWTGAGCAWAQPGDAHAMDQMLWPVIWSAADLLTAPELARVRECAGEGCSWLFLDTSRNRSRRWCSMEDCGNRAKARRHYARRRMQRTVEEGGAMKG